MSSMATTRRTATARERAPRRTGERERRVQREPRPRVSMSDLLDSAADIVRYHSRAFIVLLTLVVIVAMLYGPARDYYVARRTGEDLKAYQAALMEQNEELGKDIERLQTHEGIEDEARDRGLIYPDETSVVVEGLGESVNAPLPTITLEDDRTWYVKALDFIFRYEYGTWQ